MLPPTMLTAKLTRPRASVPTAGKLVAARTTAEARHGLRDNRLTIRHVGGSIEQRYLSADEIEAALADIFLLTPEPSWRRAIERAATAEIQA